MYDQSLHKRHRTPRHATAMTQLRHTLRSPVLTSHSITLLETSQHHLDDDTSSQKSHTNTNHKMSLRRDSQSSHKCRNLRRVNLSGGWRCHQCLLSPASGVPLWGEREAITALNDIKWQLLSLRPASINGVSASAGSKHGGPSTWLYFGCRSTVNNAVATNKGITATNNGGISGNEVPRLWKRRRQASPRTKSIHWTHKQNTHTMRKNIHDNSDGCKCPYGLTCHRMGSRSIYYFLNVFYCWYL